MCELFALNSHLAAAANFSLRGFAARGGRTADHVDGWGVAFHAGERCEVVVEDRPAAESDLASHYGQHPVLARNILVDGQPGELLLQIFSENQLGPIFFEFIQRKGNSGFGEGNFKALFETMELDQMRRGVLKT